MIQEIKSLASYYDVKVVFKKLKNLSGLSYLKEREIHLDSSMKLREDILSTFFHEYMHIYCHRRKLWKNYHYKSTNKAKLKIALRCERWIDKKAEQMLKAYDPSINYLPAYADEESGNFLRDYYRGR